MRLTAWPLVWLVGLDWAAKGPRKPDQSRRERRQFGQKIGKFQAVANRIADMKVRLETARLLLYQVA